MQMRTMCLIVVLSVFLALAGCGVDNAEGEYQWKTYESQDALLALYSENEAQFMKLVDVIRNEEQFFEKGRRTEDEFADAFLCTPYDAAMELFSESDQEFLNQFFELKPYMISYDNSKRFVKVTFIGKGEMEAGTFLCWTADDGQAETEYYDYLAYLEQIYSVETLSDCWCFYW